MDKKWKGYLTIEASFLLPMVLFLYLLIILAALFLYCRCVISQDDFLVGMRTAAFTGSGEQYGEVIYGQEPEKTGQEEAYALTRLARKRDFYPFYPTETMEYVKEREKVLIRTSQSGLKKFIEKKVQIQNPIKMIREGRRNNA